MKFWSYTVYAGPSTTGLYDLKLFLFFHNIYYYFFFLRYLQPYIFIWHYLFCMDNVIFSLFFLNVKWNGGERKESANKERMISSVDTQSDQREREKQNYVGINGITWILFSVAFLWRIMCTQKMFDWFVFITIMADRVVRFFSSKFQHRRSFTIQHRYAEPGTLSFSF